MDSSKKHEKTVGKPEPKDPRGGGGGPWRYLCLCARSGIPAHTAHGTELNQFAGFLSFIPHGMPSHAL